VQSSPFVTFSERTESEYGEAKITEISDSEEQETYEENICMSTPYTGQYGSRRRQKPVYAVRIKEDGEVERHVMATPDVVCRFGSASKHTESLWTPYFNRLMLTKKNKTVYVEGMVKVNVRKFGDEESTFYPFGDKSVDISLPPTVELTLEADNGERNQVEGAVSKDSTSMYKISYKAPEVMSPYFVKATIHVE